MTDLEIIALSIKPECFQINSENLLLSNFKNDYPYLSKDLQNSTKEENV